MPEEINRIVTDAISDLLLVSEPSGLENLRREGVPNERVVFVGNVMIDSVIHEVAAARSCGVVSGLGVAPKSFGLVTLHRPSNVDNPRRLREIVELLVDLSRHADVVAPLHPRTKGRLVEFGLRDKLQQARVRILDPVGYREMISLIESAQFVLTDSGGIQEETTFLGVPCMTLRENTERPITVTHGTNTVIGFDFALARMTIDEIRNGTYKRGRSIEGWDGNSSARIAAAILEAWAPR